MCSAFGDGRERDRAGVITGARDQVVAAGVDRGPQSGSDDLKISNLLLDLTSWRSRAQIR